MAITATSMVIGKDGGSNLIRVPLVLAGVDNNGQMYIPAVGHGYQVVTPADQVTTAGFLDVVGSTIDSIANVVVSYTLLNLDGANGISWQVLQANNADFSDVSTAQASANIAAGAVGTFSVNPALFRFFKVQIKDQVAASHASARVRGIARG